MTTNYFNKRSEMTAHALLFAVPGVEIYHTRISCSCANGRDNCRNGILVIKGNEVINKLIRCKACAKKGAENDTV